MSHPLQGNPLFLHSDRGGRRPFGSLLRGIELGQLVVPDYQRPSVWTKKQKSRWVGYVLSGAPCPAIFVREVNTPDGFRDEIIDGQQRLMALAGWVDGQFAATLWNGRTAFCSGAPDAAMVRRTGCPVVTLPVSTTRVQAMQTYVLLNSAGTQHTAAELVRVQDMIRHERGGQ